MSFFVLDHLEAAIVELGMVDEYDPMVLLNTLTEADEKDQERFVNEHNVPREPIDDFLDDDFVAHVDPNILYHAPNYCHTALIPSQLRFKGILTETDEIGRTDFYKGISHDIADSQASSDGMMRLVWDPGERNDMCFLMPQQIDFKDFFYVNDLDGWTSLTIPNDAEVAEYGPFHPKGLIMGCFQKCYRRLCQEEYLHEEALHNGTLKMKVNGVPVTKLSKAHECFFVKHEDGYFFKEEEGRFTIEVFVEPSEMERKNFVGISSFIIF